MRTRLGRISACGFIVITYLTPPARAVTPCPVFLEGYCVIDTSNPCLGKPESERTVVLIDRSGKVIKTGLGQLDIGTNLAHLADPTKARPNPPANDQTQKEAETIGVFGVGKMRGLKDSKSGKVITEPIWDAASWHSSARVAKVRLGSLWQLLDENGKALTEAKWTSININFYQPELSEIEADGQWGLLDARSGNVILEPAFQKIWKPTRDENPTFVAIDANGVGSLFDGAGKKICDLPGLHLERVDKESKGWPLQYIDDLLCYPKESGWGAIDTAGNEKLPFKYEFIGVRGQGGSIVDEGAIQVTLGGKVGFTTLDGKMISETKWDTAGFFSEGVAYVSHGKRWAFIDKTGEIALGPFEMGPRAE